VATNYPALNISHAYFEFLSLISMPREFQLEIQSKSELKTVSPLSAAEDLSWISIEISQAQKSESKI
jgi:hypothetical protein